MTTMGKHSPPIDGTVTNGHQLVPFTVPRGPVSSWPQDTAGQARAAPDTRTEPGKPGRRRRDGTAFIVVALFAVAQVAVVAFSGSWQHQYELSVHLGQAHWVAGMQPLSVEGLIASATLVIWFAARYGHGVPVGAYLVLAAGVGQTVLMNVGADYRWPWLGPEISVWPAVAFVAAYEMAVWLVRKRQDGTAARPDEDKPQAPPADIPVDKPSAVPEPEPQVKVDKKVDKPVDKPGPRGTAMDKAAAALRDHPDWTDAALARSAGVSTKTIQRARKTGSPA